MIDLDYSGASVPVRADLEASHRAALAHIRAPGTWWTGRERIAIAAAARAAEHCALCRERKAALSPNTVQGTHDGESPLSAAVVDVIHRVRTDAGRLSKPWFDDVIAGGLDVERYVELVGVVTLLAGLDYFARALGVPQVPLPEPLDGKPSRRRPGNLTTGEAWVPMVDPSRMEPPEADLYPTDAPFIPNILRALSLVPDQVRALRDNGRTHYFDITVMHDPTARRALDRLQIELVAARVSAMNECFY